MAETVSDAAPPDAPAPPRLRGLGDSLGDRLGIPVFAVDAVVNSMTGTGTTRSKSTYNRYAAAARLSEADIEILFRDNPLARRIVAKMPETALRAGFGIRRAGASPAADADARMKITRRWAELEGPKRLKRGAQWARAFGGGGLIVAATGSGPLDAPLVPSRVTAVERFIEWDRQQLTEFQWYPDGEPSHYLFTPRRRGVNLAPMVVHASRVLAFPAADATVTQRVENDGWDDSVLQAVYETLLDYDGSWASITDMFADASQAVFKLSGLIESLTEGNGNDGVRDVLTRLRTMDLTRSSSRALVLDAGDENGRGGESFEVIDRSGFGTLAPMVIQMFVRLCAAADMPMTVLLGTSPSGQDATGESDMALWFNSVDVYRQSLTPFIAAMVRMIAYEVGDEDPESWEVVWPELQRPKPLDVATARNMTVTSIMQLIDNNVVTPEEVALSMPSWVEEGLAGLDIDMPARLEALPEALREVAERDYAEEPPEPADVGPGQLDPGEDPEPPEDGPKPPPERMTERKTPSKTAGRQIG